MTQSLFLVVRFVYPLNSANGLPTEVDLFFGRIVVLGLSLSFFDLPCILQIGVTVFLIIQSYFLWKIDMLPTVSPHLMRHHTSYIGLSHILFVSSSCLCHHFYHANC